MTLVKHQARPRYSPEHDSVEIVDENGEVLVRFSRNAVINMVSLLTAEPPTRTKKPAG